MEGIISKFIGCEDVGEFEEVLRRRMLECYYDMVRGNESIVDCFCECSVWKECFRNVGYIVDEANKSAMPELTKKNKKKPKGVS